jgi:hypothetical protein
MQAIRDLEKKESMEDLFFGQVAIIWARWFLILTGGILALWNASDLENLTLAVVPVTLLMGMNFYLHGRYLMEKPVGAKLVMLTSFLDLVLISLLVVLYQGAGGPLYSEFFVFFYPMVLAFAFVMPRKIEVVYTVTACVAYAAIASISIFSTHIPVEVVPESVQVQGELKLLALRVLTLAAMGGLGNYYFRIMRRRRGQGLAAAAA